MCEGFIRTGRLPSDSSGGLGTGREDDPTVGARVATGDCCCRDIRWIGGACDVDATRAGNGGAPNAGSIYKYVLRAGKDVNTHLKLPCWGETRLHCTRLWLAVLSLAVGSKAPYSHRRLPLEFLLNTKHWKLIKAN